MPYMEKLSSYWDGALSYAYMLGVLEIHVHITMLLWIIILKKGCCMILETFSLATKQDYNTYLVFLQYDSNSY